MSESTSKPAPPRRRRRRRRARSGPSVWGGVATRILLANSLMLIGIVTLAITLLCCISCCPNLHRLGGDS